MDTQKKKTKHKKIQKNTNKHKKIKKNRKIWKNLRLPKGNFPFCMKISIFVDQKNKAIARKSNAKKRRKPQILSKSKITKNAFGFLLSPAPRHPCLEGHLYGPQCPDWLFIFQEGGGRTMGQHHPTNHPSGLQASVSDMAIF